LLTLLSGTSRYNAGHLIEAALAHHAHYHNDLLLAPIIKYVSLLYRLFGSRPDQKGGYPGHPEIELALLRLYNVTQDPRHLELSRFFIEERGNPKGEQGRHYFDVEADCRGEGKNEVPDYYPKRRSYWWGPSNRQLSFWALLTQDSGITKRTNQLLNR
jgi:uncharacterized protein